MSARPPAAIPPGSSSSYRLPAGTNRGRDLASRLESGRSQPSAQGLHCSRGHLVDGRFDVCIFAALSTFLALFSEMVAGMGNRVSRYLGPTFRVLASWLCPGLAGKEGSGSRAQPGAAAIL